MSISLFSVAVMLLTAVFVLYEIARGIRKGFYATLVHVSLVLLSVVLSVIAAKLLSNLFVDKLYEIVLRMGILDRAFDFLPNAGDIIIAYCDAALTPFVFILAYPIIMAVVRFILFMIKSRYVDFEKLDAKIKKESAPWIEKNQKLLNIIISAACGIFVASMFISPIMGTVKMAGRAVDFGAELGKGNASLEKTVENIDRSLSSYENDPIANMVYYCGGNIVYYANASSELNGNYFTLGRELKNTTKFYDDILSAAKLVGKIEGASRREVEELRNVKKYINKSETLKCIASDFVSGISGKWLEGESFMGLAKPNLTSAVNPVINKVLYVCSKTTPRYVAEDMGTLIEIYILLYESDIIGKSDYSEMISMIDDTDFIDKVSEILKKNPRMADISLDFDNMTISIVSAAMLSDMISQREFRIIAGDIADTINNVKDLPLEDQISIVTDSAYRSINDTGLDIPYDIVETTAQKLVDDVNKTQGEITSDTIRNFFEKYSADQDAVIQIPE